MTPEREAEIRDRGMWLSGAWSCEAIRDLLAALDEARRELVEVRKILPFGDGCMVCRGASFGPDGRPCSNCHGRDVEPHLAATVEAQFRYFSERGGERP